MYLTSLTLNNFRNYSYQDLVFNPRMNIFQGMNAQGKTNLLEAIYYLTVSRSFRTGQESEIVRLGCEHFSLKGTFLLGENRCLAETCYCPPHRLLIRVNGKSYRRGDYLHRHPVVVFAPDDLFLVKEGPSVRRRFLDMECSRFKPSYYSNLRDYYRALRQRNRFLKERRISRSLDSSTVAPWEQALAQKGSWIIRERMQFLEALESLARSHFASLTAESEDLVLCYRSTVNFEGNLEAVEEYFQEQLERSRAADLQKGYTLIGPHLDDFSLLINGFDVRKFASQGQQRTSVLALKMGEVDLFNRNGERRSLLLLDDVFSELDRERRRQLFEFLERRKDQSFITTAVPLPECLGDGPGRSYSFRICGGKVSLERSGTDH